jgi:uncharacterized protein YdeI (YjbR/CyaY-like superfamily)
VKDEAGVQFDCRDEWRAWLQANHGRASGVWLITWKRATGKPTLSYEDAVLEALCFGWIDGTTRTLDAERTMLRFSPRRPGSGWASSNKRRIAALEAAGLMAEAGRRVVDAARADGSWTALDAVEAMVVPDDLAAALAAAPGARESFDATAPFARKMTLGWIAQAKRPATRAARIAETVRRVAETRAAETRGWS